MDETILSSNLQLPRPFPVYAINAPKEVIVSDKAGDIIVGLLYIEPLISDHRQKLERLKP